MELYSGYFNDENIINNSSKTIKNILSKNPIIICIGSDKIILDCLGPFVGTLLKKNSNLKVIGELSNPVTAKNINSIISNIDITNNTILIVDCYLSKNEEDINKISIYNESALPGGLNINKTPIGNYKILACVDHLNNPHIYNNSTSLSRIYNLAETITNILINGAKN